MCSPKGIGMRAPLFHIRWGHVLGTVVWDSREAARIGPSSLSSVSVWS